MVENVLILGLIGIGDLVMFLPCARALRRRFPEARISLLAYPNAASLFAAQDCYDEVVIFRGNRWLFAPGWGGHIRDAIEIARKARWSRSKRFDLIIWPDIPASDLVRGAVAFILGAERRVGHVHGSGPAGAIARRLLNVHTKPSECAHTVERNLGLLSLIGIDEVHGDPTITVPAEMDRLVDAFFVSAGIPRDKMTVCIHPGGSRTTGPDRAWAPEHYAKLGSMMGTQWGADIVLFGRKRETTTLQRIADRCSARATIVAGRPLLEVAAIIRNCDLLVGNDSGLMHVSAALGRPTVGILGPTDPCRTGPRGKYAAIIRRRVNCEPCFLGPGQHPCTHRECLTKLTPEEVFDRLCEMPFVRQALRTDDSFDGQGRRSRPS